MSGLIVKHPGGKLGPLSRDEVVRMVMLGQLADEDFVKAEDAPRWSTVKEWAAVYVPAGGAVPGRATMSAGDLALMKLHQMEAAKIKFEKDKKSPVMGFALSFLLPSAGQFYAGFPWHGVGYILLMILAFAGWLHFGMFHFSFLGLSLVSGIDALLLVEKANKKLAANL